MIKQGTAIVNTEHLDSLIDRVNAATDAADLQKVSKEATDMITAQSAAIGQQLTALAPMLQLLEVPKSPVEVVTWAKKFIDSYLGPVLKPYTTYPAQLAILSAKGAQLTSAVSSAASRLEAAVEVPSIDISIPDLPPFPTPSGS